jgi:hypothetical protein
MDASQFAPLLIVPVAGLFVLGSLSTGNTLNLVSWLGPFFVNRLKQPKLFWFAIAYWSAFVVAGPAIVIAELAGWLQ